MKNNRKALVFLAIGTVLFALGPAVLKLLTTMGGRVGLDNPGSISFCNVLFVGNFSAGLVTLVTYGARPLFTELYRLPRQVKAALLAAAIVSTIYPALVFVALERTSVINVVLLSRFNGIVFVVLAYVFFRVSVRRSELLGYGMIAAAVVGLVALGNGEMTIRSGDALVLIATVFFALTEFLSKRVLRDCSIESYVFFRNLVSAVIFFCIAVYWFGFDHFADAFSGELWILMIVYAVFAVVGAQLSWLKATRVLPIKTVANAQLVNPAFSIAFAYLLLSEAPSTAEWFVVAVILIGTLIPKLGSWKPRQREAMVFGPGLAGTHSSSKGDRSMKHHQASATLAAIAIVAIVQLTHAENAEAPIVKKPADLMWMLQPSGVERAVLQGDPSKPGPFTLRLRYPAGYQKAPHYHPRDAFVTVLSGEYFRGYGNHVDESVAIRLTPGTFSVNPAKVSHYEWTTMPAEIQVHATGPWETVYLDDDAAPRNDTN